MSSDVSQVINRTALIENLLNQVILNYSSPRKDAFEFFWEVLLDSSVMPLGSKVKAAMAISHELEVKINQDLLHKVVSYRNAFAHHAVDAHTVFAVGKTPEENSVCYELHILKASGKIERKDRKQALVEFNNNYEAARKSLVKLIKVINERVKEDERNAT
jgi:hypothetical protein